jgi:hypothetical protein
LLLAGHGTSLRGQSTLPNSAYAAPADSVLSRWERDVRSRAVNNIGTVWIIQNLRHPAPGPRLDSLLDGLERFATTSDSERVRHRAVNLLLLAGEADMPRPVSAVMSRVARIHHASDAPRIVRTAIRDRMPFQANRRAAAALLRSVAAEPNPNPGPVVDDMGNPRIEALAGLRRMGAEGRAVLQAMHRSGEARDPRVRTILQEMARAGFPVREPERTP